MPDKRVDEMTDDELNSALPEFPSDDVVSEFEEDEQVTEEPEPVQSQEESQPADIPAEEEKDPEQEKEDDVRSMLSRLAARLEVAEAENERNRAEAEKFRLLADRQAGKYGSLLQQMSSKRESDSAEVEETADATSARKNDPEMSSALEEIRQERRVRVIQEVTQELSSEVGRAIEEISKAHGEETANKFRADLIDKINKGHEELREEFDSTTNPKVLARMARSIIRGAYADQRLAFLRDLREANEKKAKEASEALRSRKVASQSAPAAKKPAAQSTKQQDPFKMGDKDLDVYLKKLRREGAFSY